MNSQIQTLQLQPPSAIASQARPIAPTTEVVSVPEPTPSSSLLLAFTFCIWLLRQRTP